jgi:antitoxin ParD1/3/4
MAENLLPLGAKRIAMTYIEKVDFAVTPEMAATLREAVSSGEYATEGEVVRDALREWMSSRLRRREAVEELQRLVQEGIESEGF